MALTVSRDLTVPVDRRAPAIRLVGGLFAPDLLDQLRHDPTQLAGQKPRDFAFPDERSFRDTVAEAYRDALDLWRIFQQRLAHLPAGERATTLTRNTWVLPFFSLLGYELVRNERASEVEGRTYAISHRAGPEADAPPVHIADARQELGRVDPSGRPRLSPHALVQEFLDRSDHLWGIATNGRLLRLLRTSPRLRTETYLEFDLDALFGGERFSDFVVLYRLLHRTRLPRGIADAPSCWLERYHQQGLAEGTRARDRLRDGVEQALLVLGNGFLRHPANCTLREDLAQGRLSASGYYELLLRLVYRLLFLLVTEERGLLGGNDLYRQGYGLTRLRRWAEEGRAADEHEDCWAGLCVLWALLRGGSTLPDGRPLAALLDLPVLDGELFRPEPFEGWRLANRDLVAAIGHLAQVADDRGMLRRVNYAALDVEELGSVYESLLDHAPLVELDAAQPFRFAPGTERKSTGSYYTPPHLVRELVASALEPVLARRVAAARTREEKERAILGLKVCDPAAGSGHFLLAAARRLARELARIRTGEEEPAPERQREALREVAAHCLYAVDKNPLAVELCKVALWIEAHVPGQPLTFLDHRIRCGDSLVGVFDLRVLTDGIPDAAYDRDDPDEKRAAKGLKKTNRTERDRRQLALGSGVVEIEHSLLDLGVLVEEVARMPERTLAERLAKQQAYGQLQRDPRFERLQQACDLWTAAFFADLRNGMAVPTTDHVRRALAGQPLDPRVQATAAGLATELRFFHWPLAFPDVFAGGGFDVVLGNPPWERVKLQEEEFFASRDPWVANAPNAAERKRRITALAERDPALHAAYRRAVRDAKCASVFLRRSGRFPLGGTGDVNLYQVFTELAWRLLGEHGRAGLVVPTNIATDEETSRLFQALVDRRALINLSDFENRDRLFPVVDSRQRFSLLTLAAGGYEEPPRFAFLLHRTEELHDPERTYTLAVEDFALVNPNTLTAPVCPTEREVELIRGIYRRVPVLLREGAPDGDPWGVEFLRMFDMANDSKLFRTREQLERAGFVLRGNVFHRGAERYLPLYEAKLLHQFDHRWASYGGPGRLDAPPEPGGPPWLEREPKAWKYSVEVTAAAKRSADLVVLPRYWVPEAEVQARLAKKGWTRGWLLGWRDITNATNERTVIASVLPAVGVGHKFLLMLPYRSRDGKESSITAKDTVEVLRIGGLLANLNSLVLDFVARQKLVSTDLTYTVMKQLPILPPAAYDQPCPWSPGETVAAWLRPRVLELVYTAWDLAPFARDLGDDGPPFRWDAERRAQLRAELDAAFFLLYGLERSEVEFVLSTFPVLRENEERSYGEYRTARLVLAAFDGLVAARMVGAPYRTPLDPPPADDRVRHPTRPSGEPG
ncbi:MAG: SAM-dependent methyltransferase [Thermomicrobium sp.]|nr:SAM-dependent methyltransferase [Thermomicrobium sp.]